MSETVVGPQLTYQTIASPEVQLPYVACEATVRDEFPSAPRRTQIMLAGAAFMGDLEMTPDMTDAIDLLRQRYAADKPIPYREITASYGFEYGNTPAAQRDYWQSIENLTDGRLRKARQPEFIKQILDIPVSAIGIEERTDFTKALPAEPVRIPGVHPEPPYSREDFSEVFKASRKRQIRFWQYAEIEPDNSFQWVAKAAVDRAQAGQDMLISGPRGIGKTHLLVPAIIQELEAAGLAPRYCYAPNETELIEAATSDADVLVIDEAIVSSWGKFAKIIQSHAPDKPITFILGANGSRKIRTDNRGELAKVLHAVGREVMEHEITRLPQLSEASIRQWASENGVDKELEAFIVDQPLLRLPRLFDCWLNGSFMAPDGVPAGSQPGDTNTSLWSRHNFMTRHQARNNQLIRAPKEVLSVPDLKALLTANVNAVADSGIILRALEHELVSIGEYSDQTHDAYRDLCDALGIKHLSGGDLEIVIDAARHNRNLVSYI